MDAKVKERQNYLVETAQMAKLRLLEMEDGGAEQGWCLWKQMDDVEVWINPTNNPFVAYKAIGVVDMPFYEAIPEFLDQMDNQTSYLRVQRKKKDKNV